MKRIALITLGWSLGKPAKEVEQDKAQVAKLLRRIGMEDRFNPNTHYYDIELEVDTEVLTTLMSVLETKPNLGYLSRVDRRYTRQETELAKLLIWRPTNQAIEDDHYDFFAEGDEHKDLYRRCSACGTPLRQVRDIVINKARMGKKDISLTYSYEVILNEQVGRLLQEQDVSGFELRPVQHYKKPYPGEPTLHQLAVTNVLPPMAAPPTEFEQFHNCAGCGRISRFLKHTHWWGKIQYREDTNVYFPRRVLEVVKDFNHTAEYFGELRVAHPYVIITQRVYRLLREHKVKNWAAVPVYLVD